MGPAFGASTDESGFFSRTNHERSSRGLRGVTLDAHLSDIARRHSQDMANRHELYHNDNLGNEVENWEELDENVGEGPNVEAIHDAFMDSSVHREAILGNYEKVGIGTVWKDNVLWVTEIFYRARTATATSTRRAATRPRTTWVAPHPAALTVRTAAAPKPVPVPVTAPLGVAMPELSTGKLQKLLGDLPILGPADELEARDEGASSPGDPGFGSVLWQFVDAKAS